MLNIFLISIDVDWAPDVAIDAMAKILIEKKIKATWFITHYSPAIERLKEREDLFELGVHPNFLPTSTHGKSVKEVMDHVMSIVPNATSLRAHALVQSSPLLKEIVAHYPITVDSCILLRETPNIQPHVVYFEPNSIPLTRVPFFWEDDSEMANPNKSWSIYDSKYHCAGLKIFNFHPTFSYLNCDTISNYEELKKIKPLYQLTKADCNDYINKGDGSGNFFEEITTFIKHNQPKTYFIKDITSLWLKK